MADQSGGGIQVSLDTEAVQRQLVEAILGSTLGDKIQEAVNRALAAQGYGRGNVIDQAVEAEVHEQVRFRCRELIREPGPIRDLLENRLREALAPEALDKIAKAFVTDLGLITKDDMR